MANIKIMDLTAGTPVDSDYIPFVDVSDTTQSAAGSTKRALKSELDGADGKTILNGSVDPTTEGVDGDFYINTTSWEIFGPKSGNWGTGTSIIGPQGIQGIQGNTGATGETGATGATGATGNGIASITLISIVGLVKTYRITYTDATTFDFTVTDGTNGTNGTNGTDGLDINWLGAYNGATAYVINDAVSYNGSSYICKLASTGNLPTNTTYFDLMAEKGADGIGSGDMLKSENLSGLANYATARTNLGLDTTANQTDSVDKRFMTDAQETKLDAITGTNTGDETTTTLGSKINSAIAKTTPVDADMVGLMDSAGSNVLKKLSWANIKATLKTYFDSLTTTLTNKTISLTNNTISGTKSEFDTACSDGNFVYTDGNQSIAGNKNFASNTLYVDNTNYRVGIGTSSPNASAKLDITSTTQGFLPPRMTTTQRDAIASPATGLIVYNTTLNTVDRYNGTVWNSLGVINTPVVITATAGQTVFTVNTYTTNRIQVYVNGLLQTKTTDYTETNSTTITMVTGLTAGDEFKYIIL